MAVIGIIAAMTLPNLMQKWQNEATVTKVKKGYNSITRMATNIKANTNCDDLDCTGLFNYSDEELHKQFTELSGLKDAQVKATNNWGRVMYLYCEKEICVGTEGGSFSNYILTQDGMGYIVQTYQRGEYAPAKFIIVTLLTDPKLTKQKRSTYKSGRNAFYFVIADDFHAEPAVYVSDGSTWTLSEASQKMYNRTSLNAVHTHCSFDDKSILSGSTCAAKILLDGWKINY